MQGVHNVPPPLAILSALPQEQHGLIDQLEAPQRVQHAGREFWCGSLQGVSVVLALSRIGKVAAATTAAALMERFAARALVFTGVAGGVGPGVRVGDVVLGSSYVQHDMDASPLFPRFEVPLTGRSLWQADAQLLALVQTAAQRSVARVGKVSHAAAPTPLLHVSQVHTGLIASGDRFVNGADEVQQLVQRLQAHGMQPLAVEMEGAAVAQVCADYAVPFVAMRTISDRADDAAAVDFTQFVEDVASVYARQFVAELLPLMPTLGEPPCPSFV